MQTNNFPENTSFTLIYNLLKTSFIFLKGNWKKIFSITLIALIPIGLSQMFIKKAIAYSLGQQDQFFLIFIAIAIILALILILILSISHPISLIYLIHGQYRGEEINVKKIYQANKKYFFPYLILSILLMIIIKGSNWLLLNAAAMAKAIIIKTFSSKIIIFSLFLFILIAVLLLMAYLVTNFIFSFFILICENGRIWHALKKSIFLARHYWWQIFLRFAAFVLIFSVINEIFKLGLKNMPYAIIIIYYFLFALFFIPFTIIYLFNIYIRLAEKC